VNLNQRKETLMYEQDNGLARRFEVRFWRNPPDGFALEIEIYHVDDDFKISVLSYRVAARQNLRDYEAALSR
jgi:hypothetical protein